MTEETRKIQRMDALLIAMKGKKTEWVNEGVCGACGNPNRRLLTDNDGHFVCADCYPHSYQTIGTPPNSVPQGDMLVRLPTSPRFTKKFT